MVRKDTWTDFCLLISTTCCCQNALFVEQFRFQPYSSQICFFPVTANLFHTNARVFIQIVSNALFTFFFLFDHCQHQVQAFEIVLGWFTPSSFVYLRVEIHTHVCMYVYACVCVYTQGKTARSLFQIFSLARPISLSVCVSVCTCISKHSFLTQS